MTILNNGLVTTDKELNIISADEGYREYVCEDGASTIFANIHPDDQHLLYEMVEGLEMENALTLCFRVCDKNKEYNWFKAECIRTTDDNVSILFLDIEGTETENKAIETDYLTGLYNKKAITDYARKAVAKKSDVVNLCLIDIDNFKQINDTYGHSYGDKVLKEVSNIILEVLGKDGKAGRIGGDELMMIIENVEEKTDLRVYLKAIRERVEASHIDQNGFPQVTVSMGVGTFPIYVDNYEDLFNLAGRMLSRAKNRGKNRYVIYNPEIHGKLIDGELVENMLSLNRATAMDKTKLVLETIDGLFGSMNEAITTLLLKMVATYDLDEAYVFYKDIEKSFCGYKRIAQSGNIMEKNVHQIADNSSSISYVVEPGFETRFNSNGVLVIDAPQTQLDKTAMPKRFFFENGVRQAFLYKMQDVPYEGFIALYRTREMAGKLPQTDITDLTYLSKMIEIAMKSR
ncbi:GGDEF domain-containing protein [Butyrivibrio sp. CB08]|uniref:GGDEF domain-containing protein n=1 Tax=Butyrivibrio sp. CB08 TaxID=2364879 RepID=UPI000EA9A2E0|nr:GGDEF domain-containing protein [Butyrivibrio sp. CB08]RKM62279.1 GGDEF domain-containing protein [Butyrivibrio sp. CB08]